MKITLIRKNIDSYIPILIYIIIAGFNYINVISGSILLFITILYNLYFLKKFRNMQSLVVCLSFALTYWLYMVFYYFLDISYCTYKQYQLLDYTNGTLRIVGIFFVLLFSKIKPIETKIENYLPHRKNRFLLVICVSVMIGILLYTASIGQSFSYKAEGVNSSLYEYYLIFALLAYCFTGNIFEKRCLLVLNFIYVFSLLRLGLRLVVLQILLMLFIQYFDKKIRTSKLFILIIIGFLFMSFWSMFRSGVSTDSFISIFGIKDGTLITNQGDVFYTSSAQYAQLAEGIWSIYFRIVSLVSFIANIFIPPAYQFADGKLNEVLAKQFSLVPGGGFGAMYVYVWLGWIGIYLFADFIANRINSIKDGHGFFVVYGVFLIFTFFRWYAYNIAVIFKMGFWFLLIYLFSKAFDETIRIQGRMR